MKRLDGLSDGDIAVKVYHLRKAMGESQARMESHLAEAAAAEMALKRARSLYDEAVEDQRYHARELREMESYLDRRLEAAHEKG